MNQFDKSKRTPDKDGYFWHEDLPPSLGENISMRPALMMMGLDCMYEGLDEEDRFPDGSWNISQFDNEKWVVAAVFESEDGPVMLTVGALDPDMIERRMDSYMLSILNERQTYRMQKASKSGRAGWWDYSMGEDEYLIGLLYKAVEDKDWISVANYSGMLEIRKQCLPAKDKIMEVRGLSS